jgi:histidinol dehydrogenase
MIITPKRLDDFNPVELQNMMERSAQDVSSVYEGVREIVEDVKKRGDDSLLDANRGLKEEVTRADLKVTPGEIAMAYGQVGRAVIDSLRIAARNITRFHQAQTEREMWSIEVSDGIVAGRMIRPMDRVGCYIPGGRAAYPSTVLMTAIPAMVAGVQEVILTTPAGNDMLVHPATLVAADLAGCRKIYKVGGPWGIAALAYGTDTLPKVDKIVGPGNKYVTAAKMIVYGRVDIDSPAGPSEALILADETADPALVALDFLSQIEHDPDSAAVLVTPSSQLADAVCREIQKEFSSLSRKEIFESSLSKSHVIIVADIARAVAFSNDYAPEHLEIVTEDPHSLLHGIKHAGSIFLGPYAPVPVGDYASGTNHVLPTARCARMFSGLSVDDFIKKPTFQYLSKEGLRSLKNVVTTLAEAEGLPNHARAVLARFKDS